MARTITYAMRKNSTGNATFDSDSPALESAPRLSPISHVFAWAVLSMAFTMLVLHYSMTRGKLIVPATYDDVSYLRDGLDKLDGFYRGGFSGLLSRSLLKPPHSPFSTLVAFAGYAFFGVHDWAPYAANGIIIFALLAFTDFLTRGMKPWQKLAAFLFVLTLPIAAQSVYEFRADMAVGLLTAAALVLMLEQALVKAGRAYLLGTGLILAVALLSKTSIFPVTLGLAAAGLVAASARDRLLLGRAAGLKAMVSSWATILLPALLIPLPFYVRNRHEIFFYITVNALGSNSDIWKLHASYATHLLYYVTGEGANVMLGRHVFLIAAVVLAGVFGLVIRGRKPQVVRAACYAFLLAVAYTGPTLNPIKDPFLAVVFDFLLVFAALLSFRDLLSASAAPWMRRAAQVALVIVTLMGGWYAKWPMYWGEITRPDVVTRNRYMHDLYAAIRGRDDGKDETVLVGVAGAFANADAFGYMADKEGLTRLQFVSEFTNSSLDSFRRQLDSCQFVILGDPDNPEDNQNTPYSAMLDRTLALVRSRRDYRLISTSPTPSGKNYYLFERQPAHS